MKKQLLIGLCAAGVALVSIPTRTSAVEVKNVITRTFPVSASSVLKIDNTFGDVVIAPGKRSEIDFRIEWLMAIRRNIRSIAFSFSCNR